MKFASASTVFLLCLCIVPFAHAQTQAELNVRVQSSAKESVPLGAQRVEMLTLTFTASCDENVVVDAVRLHHAGLGDSSDIVRLYAMENGRRITRSASFNTSDESATLRLRGLEIPACDSKTITVLGDISPTASPNAEHRLALKNGGDITSDADHVGIVSVGASQTRVLTSAESSMITVEYPSLTVPVKYGKNRIVARIKLSANGTADQLISALTLTNDGKARDDDLQNLRFKSSKGELLGKTQSSLDGEIVKFVFDTPILLRKNQSRLFEVLADVASSRKKTIRLLIEEPSDIEATITKQRGVIFQ